MTGAGWTAFGAVDINSAVVLDPVAKIRFVPDPGYSGSAGNITFRAWDQTDGNPSGTTGVDVSVGGGTAAYSVASETATLNVLSPQAPLLDLDGDSDQIKVTYGLLPKSENEVAVLTRSMLQMMIALSTTVEVPDQHLEQKMTDPIKVQPGEEEAKLGPLMRIQGGSERPENAFVSVNHLNHWFWIDEGDFASKRTFTFLMLLFSMMESEDSEGLPLVTIPAG